MHRTAARLVTLAGALLLVAGTAGAQEVSQRPVKIGGALGATLPLGDFGDVADVGYHFGGLVDWTRPGLAFGLRGEITYHRNGMSDIDEDISILGFVANVTFPLGQPEATARPYLIGGLGFYRTTVHFETIGGDTEDTSDTDFGFNLGGGFTFNLTGFETFVEARFHSVSGDPDNLNFIPLSFGFRF